MKFKKSQITMLIIIGLVIFIAVSLVLYITKLSVSKQSQQSVKKTQVASLETQPIKEFVTQCLDKLAKEAVILLGKQGGYIYKNQGGITTFPQIEGVAFVKYNNYDVAYNIIPLGFQVGDSYPNPPKYPWESFPYKNAVSNEMTFVGNFGKNALPALNSSDGYPNFQQQIETLIDSNMLSCTNFEIFKNQGFDISIKKPNTSVVISSKDITVNLNFPITISNSKTRETADISDFSTTINVRLKEIYLFTKELIEKDIHDISFEIDKAENKNSFKIDIIRSVLVKGQSSNDDIVKVIDENSLISGNQFEYIFARKNRAPALYCIRVNNKCKLSQTILQFPYGHPITEQDLLGTTLQNLQKNAKDPDENSLTFSITDFAGNPQNLPKKLDIGEINFRVQVSDGKIADYQYITVKAIT